MAEEAEEFHSKKVVVQKAITDKFTCLIHSLPEKAVLCWKDPQGLCYPITENNLNFWTTVHVSDIY